MDKKEKIYIRKEKGWMMNVSSTKSEYFPIDSYIFKRVLEEHEFIILKKCSRTFCQLCYQEILDEDYVKIINQLKSKDLLIKSYPLLCCGCYLKFIEEFEKAIKTRRRE